MNNFFSCFLLFKRERGSSKISIHLFDSSGVQKKICNWNTHGGLSSSTYTYTYVCLKSCTRLSPVSDWRRGYGGGPLLLLSRSAGQGGGIGPVVPFRVYRENRWKEGGDASVPQGGARWRLWWQTGTVMASSSSSSWATVGSQAYRFTGGIRRCSWITWLGEFWEEGERANDRCTHG